MSRSPKYRAYEYAMEVLASDQVEDFEQLRSLVDTFPHGTDELFGRSWIRNAVDCGSLTAVRWIVENDVDLAVEDEGYTPLHAAVERDLPQKYEILQLLLRAGAQADARGLDDVTPADLAAARHDAEALRLFAEYGAQCAAVTTLRGSEISEIAHARPAG